MNNRKWMLVIGVIGLLGCLTRASANVARRNWFSSSASVWAEYIDNRDSVGQSDDKGKESTWDFGVTPTLNFLYNRNLTFFDLSYAPTFRHRTNPAESQNENSVLHDLGARISHEPGRRMSLRLENRFSYSDDPEITVGGDVLRRDSSYFFNRLSGGINYALTRQVGADIETSYNLKRYDEDEVAETSDEDQIAGQLRIQRQHNPSISYSVLGRFMKMMREDALDLNRDLQTYSLGVGLRNTFSPHLNGEFDAGMQWVDYDETTLKTVRTPFIQAQMTYAASASTALYAGGMYTATEAYNYPFISQDMRSVFFGASWKPRARMTFGTRGEYRVESHDREKIDPDTTADAFVKERGGDTQRLLLSAWTQFQVSDRFRLELRHQFEDIDSDVAIDFQRNATRLSAHMEF